MRRIFICLNKKLFIVNILYAYRNLTAVLLQSSNLFPLKLLLIFSATGYKIIIQYGSCSKNLDFHIHYCHRPIKLSEESYEYMPFLEFLKIASISSTKQLHVNGVTAIYEDAFEHVDYRLTEILLKNLDFHIRYCQLPINLTKKSYEYVFSECLKIASISSTKNLHVNGVAAICEDAFEHIDNKLTGILAESLDFHID